MHNAHVEMSYHYEAWAQTTILWFDVQSVKSTAACADSAPVVENLAWASLQTYPQKFGKRAKKLREAAI